MGWRLIDRYGEADRKKEQVPSRHVNVDSIEAYLIAIPLW